MICGACLRPVDVDPSVDAGRSIDEGHSQAADPRLIFCENEDRMAVPIDKEADA